MSSIINGLFSGRSGIQSHGTAISVLSDNIANQNTVGFKAGRADFVDLLAGSIGGAGNSRATGSGSSVKNVTSILTQGTFESTGRGLDLAIDGNGYFIVESNTGVPFYTRAGNFSVDPDGNLLDQNGNQVQGFSANGAGQLGSLNVNNRVADDIATTDVSLTGNLDATSADMDLATIPGNGAGATYADLNNLSAFGFSFSAFDSLGASHDMRTFFYKSDAGAGEWEARVYADGADIDDPQAVAGEPFEVATIPMNFNASGQLINPQNSVVDNVNFQWSNGAEAADLEFDYSQFTQFASPSSIEATSQNGTGSGAVVGFSVTDNGELVAQLDNGQTASIGTIALANFANNEGLNRIGNSLFAASTDSGEPVVGTPGVGTLGSIESGALELSTSDMAADFIKLISLQRGFQGSSRVVGSISDLLNEVVNLAR